MENLLTAAFLVRYVLPGSVVVFSWGVLPVSILRPSTLKDIDEGTALIVAVVVLSILVGYIMDVLGTYALNPRYADSRERYFKQIASLKYSPEDVAKFCQNAELRVRAEEILAEYWAHSREAYTRNIEEPRAKWVLALQIAPVALVSCALWSAFLGLAVYADVSDTKPGLLSGLSEWLPSAPVSYTFLVALPCAFFVVWRRALNRGFDWQQLGDRVALSGLDSYLRQARERRLLDVERFGDTGAG